MPNPAAAAAIAQRLPQGLPHPGDPENNQPPFVIPLPGFRSAGMSPEQASEFIGQSAQLWAEAIVHLIEGDFEILTKAEARQLREAAADAPDGTRIISIATTPNGEPVLQITVKKTDDRAIIPAAALKEAAKRL